MYKYFCSFITNNNECGNSTTEFKKKITGIEDIRAWQKSLEEHFNVKKLIILHFQEIKDA